MTPDILTDGLQDDRELDSVVDMIKFMCEKFSDDVNPGILINID